MGKTMAVRVQVDKQGKIETVETVVEEVGVQVEGEEVEVQVEGERKRVQVERRLGGNVVDKDVYSSQSLIPEFIITFDDDPRECLVWLPNEYV